jgi:hypothetical protein
MKAIKPMLFSVYNVAVKAHAAYRRSPSLMVLFSDHSTYSSAKTTLSLAW